MNRHTDKLHQIKNLILERVELIAGLIAFLAFQVRYIHLAHYWDESWVYAPAIRKMSTGVPSILPDAIPLELSRGHPLLLQFLGGTWMKIFGMSNASAHLFALAISCATLIAVYELLRSQFGRTTAVYGFALLVVQPIFMAQSAMLYPEMLMGLGLVIALKYYLNRNLIGFAIGMGIALFSKESAIVFLVAFVLWDLYRAVVRDIAPSALKILLLPIALVLSHPLLSYLYHGWFFYPDHTGLIKLEIQDIKYYARMVYFDLFEGQSRNWMVYAVLVIVALSLRLKRFYFNIILIVLAFCVYKVFVWKWPLEGPLFFMVIGAFFILPFLFWHFLKNEAGIMTVKHHFVGISLLILFGFTLFSAMNFYTPRYLLSVVILLCVFSAVVLFNVSRFPKWMRTAMAVTFIAISIYGLVTERSSGEINLGLYDDLAVNEAMVNWMVENVDRDENVCTNFITAEYLNNIYAGYVDASNFFLDPRENVCDQACASRYVIFTNTSGGCDEGYLEQLLNEGASIIYSDTIGASYAVVLKK